MKDYYKILGVDPSAEAEVITSAYKALVRKYHPDSYKGADAEERMKELNEAYEVLNNHLKRADYDRSRDNAGSSPPPSDKKDESDLKKCPYCAEMIKAEAILCKHCGKSLTSSEPKQETPGNNHTATTSPTTTKPLIPKKVILAIAVFCFVFLLVVIGLMNTPSSEEDKKYSDIFAAIKANNLQAVKDFVRKNPSLVNTKGEEGYTPLQWAAIDGHRDIAELLISKGADINAKTKATPLYFAAGNGHQEVAELLISKGADVNAGDEGGTTPLQWAAGKGHRDIAELLISKGADVNAKDKNGQTPLHAAAGTGHRDIAELLISNGANVKTIDKDGATPLHVAAVMGRQEHQDIAEILLSKGADVNAADNNGETPLQWAALMGQRDMAELLISKGAYVKTKYKDGY